MIGNRKAFNMKLESKRNAAFANHIMKIQKEKSAKQLADSFFGAAHRTNDIKKKSDLLMLGRAFRAREFELYLESI